MESQITTLVIAVFLVAGCVKGVIGFGLPTVSVGIIAVAIGLTEAMALMLLPSFVTNFWQGIAGGNLCYLVRRLWLVFLTGALVTWIACSFLVAGEVPLFRMLLGFVICGYSLCSLFLGTLPSPGKKEIWLSPIVGLISGGITGVTGVFVMPAVVYLQSLRLPPNVLIQAMGVWFSVATISLGLSLSSHGLLTRDLTISSILVVFPALIGMALGKRLRLRISKKIFRKIFLVLLGGLGFYIFATSLAALY